MTQADQPKPEPTPAAREPFRWRRLLQYKLRTLLFVVIPVCSVFFAWWSYRAHQQRAAVAAIEAAGGSVRYDFEQNKLSDPRRWPKWMVDAIGVDYFADVHVVIVLGPEFTDAGLERCKELTKLQELFLLGTNVTDAGLEHLTRLTNLNRLYLWGSDITDRGLEHLKGQTKLQELYLGGTKVTDAGVARLKKSLPNCKIEH